MSNTYPLVSIRTSKMMVRDMRFTRYKRKTQWRQLDMIHPAFIKLNATTLRKLALHWNVFIYIPKYLISLLKKLLAPSILPDNDAKFKVVFQHTKY